MGARATRSEVEWRNRRVAAGAAAFALAMLGLAFAAVPLYRLFCQVTGYGGTIQRAGKPADVVLDRTIRVRFDANVGGGLGWTFRPTQATVDVKIGESTLAYYRATNTSGRPLTGSATFNVTPEVAGAYFNKLECFCFKEQRLEAGESIDLPVSFYVDPALVQDKSASRLREITLSYTFYPVATLEAADKPAAGKGT